MGPVVAEEALATIRSVVNPSDFGTFEEFGISGANPFRTVQSTLRGSTLESADQYTIPGDFPFMRPSMCVAQPDQVDTQTVAAELPYGSVTVECVVGGSDVPADRGFTQETPLGDAIVMANAAVIVCFEE